MFVLPPLNINLNIKKKDSMKNIYQIVVIIALANCLTFAQLLPPFHISPKYGSIQTSLPVVFQWTLTSSATKYWIQISTDPSFLSIHFENQNISETFLPLSIFQNGSTYYWRLKAGNNTIWSHWSSISNFTYNTSSTLQAPNLLVPANGSNQLIEPIEFSWSSITGATKYFLQVATNNTFTNFLYNDSNLTNTSKQISGFQNGSTYYWRVKAGNSKEWSSWSTINTLTFNRTTVPDPLMLISPHNGSFQVSEPVHLIWAASNGSEKYWIQVAMDSNFTMFFVNDSSYSLTSFFLAYLQTGSTYYWRIKSRNAIGWNEWSSVWHFQYQGPPSPPVILMPDHNSNQTTEPIVFSWDTSHSSTNYWLQISNNSNFNNLVYNDSTIINVSVSVSGFLSETVYFWRVKARNSAGWSTWSPVWNFSYNATSIPNNVTLISPTHLSTQYDIFMQFNWSTSPPATKYWLQITTDSSFNNIMVDESNLTRTSMGLVGFESGVTYYWRVKGGNSIGWGDWSETWQFTYGFIVPTLLNPLKDSTQKFIPIYFNWHIGPQTAKYWFQVADDNIFSSIFYNDTNLTSNHISLNGFQSGKKYYWRVKAVYAKGQSEWSPIWNFNYLDPSSVRLNDHTPDRFMLYNNYPNPFNPSTNIEFSIPSGSHVTVTVYNMLGQEVANLVNERLNPGVFKTTWDGKNAYGNQVPSGMYFYRIVATPSSGGEPYIETRKMLLLK